MSLLNGIQLDIYNKVATHATLLLHNRQPAPFRLNVDGTAGTGKSFLIDAISHLLHDLRNNLRPGTGPLLRRLAPTGVAAYNISGQTYHSALGLRAAASDSLTFEIAPSRLARLQEAWHGTSYLIIDEKSMLGRVAMGRIDHRLRQIFPNGKEQPFGGLSVILVGDFGQLPPVLDTPLYQTAMTSGQHTTSILSNLGAAAYLSFTESVTLQQVMRQADTDEQTAAFKNALANIRAGQAEPADHDLLASRAWERLTSVEQQPFSDSVILATTTSSVNTTNLSALLQSGKPVLLCPARHTGGAAAKAAKEELAEGLQMELKLIRGAKVMITRNLWTDQGLTNGSMGEVVDFGFSANDNPGSDLPSVIMVACPSYRGPTEWHTAIGIPIVPITPVTATWEAATGTCSRTQFPLRLAYAITVHKSQGMTLPKARIDLGEKDFSVGLTFVALSRVKRLDDLALINGFGEHRLRTIGGPPTARRCQQEDQVRRENLGFHIMLE